MRLCRLGYFVSQHERESEREIERKKSTVTVRSDRKGFLDLVQFFTHLLSFEVSTIFSHMFSSLVLDRNPVLMFL